MQQTADIRRLEWGYWELNQPKRGRGGAEGLNDFWLGEEHMMCNESAQRFQSNRKARERKRWCGIFRHESGGHNWGCRQAPAAGTSVVGLELMAL
jgi:hypothetical protein